MYCSNCGIKFEDDGKFCSECGNPRKKAEIETQETEKIEKIEITEEIQEVHETEEVQGQNNKAVENIPDVFNNLNNSGDAQSFDNANDSNISNIQMQSVNLEPVTPKKRPVFAKIISGAAILAVLAAAVVIGVINIPKLFKPHANNCVTVTLESISSISGLSSFDYKVDFNDGEYDYHAEGYYKLGKDYYDSIFELNTYYNDEYSETTGKAVFHKGSLGIYSIESYGEWDDEPYEYYEYIDSEMITDALFESLRAMGIDISENDIDINKFIKDGKFNIVEINRLAEIIDEKMSKSNPDDYGYGGLSDYLQNTEKMAKEISKLAQNFLYVQCEKKDVLNEFATNLDISKNGELTTYNYTIKISKLINSFVKYLIKSVPEYPELSNALTKFANDSEMSLAEFLNAMAEELTYELENVIDDETDEIKISLTVTKKRVLEKLSVSFNTISYDYIYGTSFDDYEITEKTVTVSFEITLDNHNKVTADLDKADSFLKKAKEKAESYDIWDDWDWDVY